MGNTARKTVTVAALVERVNRMLAAEGGTADGRTALAVLLESVLMDAGAYDGYNLLSSELVEVGHGSVWDDTPQQVRAGSLQPRQGYDNTRRVYFNR